MYKHKRLPVILALVFLSTTLGAADINQASEMELDALKGVGPALSGRILSERAKADFKDWRDLLVRVKGLGPSQAARLSSQGLTVAGAAFDPGAPPSGGKNVAPASR